MLPVAVEGLCSTGTRQQGALPVGSHSSVSSLALRNRLLGLQLETGNETEIDGPLRVRLHTVSVGV